MSIFEKYLPILRRKVMKELLELLKAGEENTVTDLYLAINRPQSTVSNCLKELTDLGLVKLRIEGVKHFYKIEIQMYHGLLRARDEFENIVVKTRKRVSNNQ